MSNPQTYVNDIRQVYALYEKAQIGSSFKTTDQGAFERRGYMPKLHSRDFCIPVVPQLVRRHICNER